MERVSVRSLALATFLLVLGMLTNSMSFAALMLDVDTTMLPESTALVLALATITLCVVASSFGVHAAWPIRDQLRPSRHPRSTAQRWTSTLFLTLCGFPLLVATSVLLFTLPVALNA